MTDTQSLVRSKGWTRRAIRNARRRLTNSIVFVFFVGLGTELLGVFIDTPRSFTVWKLVIIAGVLLTIFVIMVFQEVSRESRIDLSATYQQLTPNQLSRITHVALIMPAPGGRRPWRDLPVGDLFASKQGSDLKHLRCIYGFVSENDNGPKWTEEFEVFQSLLEGIKLIPIENIIHRFRFENRDIRALAKCLKQKKKDLGPDDLLIVDITGDNKVLTILLYLAAVKADLPVTAKIQYDPNNSSKVLALKVLHDPKGVFPKEK